ncbi:redoxin domain-containing protein [Sphingobacterium kitahiroshimense]|uniref:TlpA family protein disulfide reductase n=1 Tax=Sphingobacterium sp. B16(2022) TaxID=2914044 RepID=UPI001438D117|nr:redoxin domain-containing protein [Sphingobacterium sp. B16(2022)]NJI76330.1 redoxin domain-containing protein [Sphingobacterium sp. B16(2022)]
MNNFYKGGRVHAYFKGIIQSICRIRIKCNMHGILPKYSVTKKALENNIAHTSNVDFISQYAFGEGSKNLREDSHCRLDVEEKISKRLNSYFFLTKLTPTSKFLRLGFDSASGFHRLQRMKSRSIVEQNPSGCRKKGREKEKKVSRSFLDMANSKSKLFLGGTRCMPTFNKLRILFYLRTSLHRMGTVPLPSLHQEKDGAGVLQVLRSYSETYYKVKRRLKESPNKIGADGFAFFMIFMKIVLAKIVVKVRLVYRLFTNALLKWYGKGTEKLLESYQIGTNGSSLAADLKATAGEAPNFNRRRVDQASVKRCICIDKAWIVRKTVSVYTLLTHCQRFIPASSILDLYAKSALFQISVFKHLKILSWVTMWSCVNKLANRLKTPLNNMLSSVHDAVSEWGVYEFRKLMGISFNALNNIRTYSLLVLMFFNLLDCFLMELKSIRTYSLLVLMVSMFSLSAQTPRKDSGADGLSDLLALQPGDRIPDAVLSYKMEILNTINNQSEWLSLDDIKEDIIILDLWGTWCTYCINSFPHLFQLQKTFAGKIKVLPVVNQSKNVVRKALEKQSIKDIDGFFTALDNNIINTYFPSSGYPHIVIIFRNEIVSITLPEYVESKVIEQLLNKHISYLPLKRDASKAKDTPLLRASMNDLIQYKPLSYRTILGFQDGLISNIILEKDINGTRWLVPNMDIMSLFELAYFDYDHPVEDLVGLANYPNRRILLTSELAPLFLPKPLGVYPRNSRLNIQRKYFYTYENISSRILNAQELKHFLAKDLDNYLGVQSRLMKVPMNCYVLKKLKDFVGPKIEMMEQNSFLRYINHPVFELPPVILFEKNRTIPNLNLEERPYNFIELKNELESKGWTITSEIHPILMLVFSKEVFPDVKSFGKLNLTSHGFTTLTDEL